MKLQNIKKGFTLIELLVVITIIGILATGAVGIFTKQLQGARDSTRIKDVKLLESANNLYFSDNDRYPSVGSYSGEIASYMSKEVEDPKTGGSVCFGSSGNNGDACRGQYNRFSDSNNLPDSAFKLGIVFEKEENYSNIASNTGSKGDNGTYAYMYEIYAGLGAGSHSGATFTGSGNTIY
ncbi:MAG: type II secretion system protein [Candidatus Gracilibacteria bacterium]|nr:type II secretion system protein [Candidatus Gracilibacteria bacterium]